MRSQVGVLVLGARLEEQGGSKRCFQELRKSCMILAQVLIVRSELRKPAGMREQVDKLHGALAFCVQLRHVPCDRVTQVDSAFLEKGCGCCEDEGLGD